MKQNFSLSGVPDFNLLQTKRRDYILSIIKNQLEIFGFSPLSTAAIQRRTNLFGNYGDEIDKLIFQILKSGDYLKKVDLKEKNINIENVSSKISDKALRYDLTVPLVKFLAENKSQLNFPFKRYEIGSVWRADRAQKGRLKEFTQCDADIVNDFSGYDDVVSSVPLVSQYDILFLIQSVFFNLGLKGVTIKINSRVILKGLFHCMSYNLENFIDNGVQQIRSSPKFDKSITFLDFCTILDKKDKIGKEGVEKALLEKGFLPIDVSKLTDLLETKTLDLMDNFFEPALKLNDEFKVAVSFIRDFISNDIIPNSSSSSINFEFDLGLARGLDYYSGLIFEVVVSDLSISIAGGGVYDNTLTTKFGLNNISGIGVSFGLDRIYLAMEEQDLFVDFNTLDVLFINNHSIDYNQKLDGELHALSYVCELRKCGKSSEVFPFYYTKTDGSVSKKNLKKQMSYANKRGVRYVVILGEKFCDVQKKKIQTFIVKDMETGDQNFSDISKLIDLLNKDE